MGASTGDDDSVTTQWAWWRLFISSLTWAGCLAYLCRWQPRPDDRMSKSTTPTSLFLFVRIGAVAGQQIKTIMCYRYVILTVFALSLSVFSGFAQNAFSEPPIASNKINSVRLSELNLKSSDYTVLNTVTETSLISLEYRGKNKYSIMCEDENFRLEYAWVKDKWQLCNWEGVVKVGFLSNENDDLFVPKSAAIVAKRLAIYKLINEAQMKGADGVIEPIISMNMARNGKRYYYKTTASGKLIKLNTNN